MGGVIEVPAHVPGFPALESTPEGAETLATDLRAVAVDVKNAESLLSGWAEPGWQGQARDAQDHALTRFVVRLDDASAALDVAVAAAGRFEERISALSLRRAPIETERISVNADCAELVRQIDAATDDSQEQTFRSRAATLRTRAAKVSGEIAAWVRDYDQAESEFIAALERVDTLREGRIAADAASRPDVDALRAQLRRIENDPRAVAAWWAGLTPAQREALTTDDPALVGNANGIPTRDRDEANRAAVYADIDYLSQRKSDGELTEGEEEQLTNAEKVREQLDKYRDLVDPLTGHELGYVMVYKPGEYGGDGAVAFAFGDPDLADNVAAFVPGFSNTTSSLDGNLNNLKGLYDTSGADHRGSTSTIFWLDYNAPDFSGDPAGIVDGLMVTNPLEAMAGGHHFADFIAGLHATDQGPAAHLTAIGHSYGSTTVGHALLDGAQVDDAILIGSPGQPVANAALFPHVGHVWVGSMDHDPVTLLGESIEPRIDGITAATDTLGFDPAQGTFGGTRFATGDGTLRVEDLLQNHSSYFQGQSLHNMAHIVSGDDGAVTTQDHRHFGNYLTLPELVGAASANSGAHALWDGAVDLVDDVGSTITGLTHALDPRSWL